MRARRLGNHIKINNTIGNPICLHRKSYFLGELLISEMCYLKIRLQRMEE